MKSVALIELGGSHDECLHAQVAALRAANRKVILVTTKPVAARILDTRPYDQILLVDLGEGFNRYRNLWQLNRKLAKLQLERIVLNTASGGPIKRLLSLPNYPPVPTWGILHDIGRLRGSIGQALIARRLTGYLVLADYLQRRGAPDTKLPISTFYAIEHAPSAEETDRDQQIGHARSELGVKRLELCVPGQVSEDRRDYLGLIDMMAKVSPEIDYHVTFLGRSLHAHGDGEAIRTKLRAKCLSHRVTLYDSFIAPAEFQRVLAKADYFLPLIHPGHRSAKLYHKQITGTYSLALGRKNTLLMHEDCIPQGDLRDVTIAYNLDSFAQLLQTLTVNRPTAAYALDCWQAEVQRENYLRALRLS